MNKGVSEKERCFSTRTEPGKGTQLVDCFVARKVV